MPHGGMAALSYLHPAKGWLPCVSDYPVELQFPSCSWGVPFPSIPSWLSWTHDWRSEGVPQWSKMQNFLPSSFPELCSECWERDYCAFFSWMFPHIPSRALVDRAVFCFVVHWVPFTCGISFSGQLPHSFPISNLCLSCFYSRLVHDAPWSISPLLLCVCPVETLTWPQTLRGSREAFIFCDSVGIGGKVFCSITLQRSFKLGSFHLEIITT